MTAVRGAHAATLLDNGDVLITGGENGFRGDQVTASAELYNPETHTFTAAGTMHRSSWYTSLLGLARARTAASKSAARYFPLRRGSSLAMHSANM
jgi:hypothetical protein